MAAGTPENKCHSKGGRDGSSKDGDGEGEMALRRATKSEVGIENQVTQNQTWLFN